MKTIKSIDDFQSQRDSLEGSVGFVPTMGALHHGHGELIKRSVADNDCTIVSIFVNPTQFNNPNDLQNYPKTLASDLELSERLGVDLIFMPEYEHMYPDDFRYLVDETSFSKELCGEHRPGHFTGVLTIVMKLFNLVRPDRAYFGEKDFQQLQLIKDMASAFFLSVDVIGVPTIREEDGLASSSRNLNLTAEERQLAPQLNRAIKSCADDEMVIERLQNQGFNVDYVRTIGKRRFAAVSLGSVRLIDNVQVPS